MLASYMKDADYLTLDGRSLHIFLTILEQGSVRGAAEKLGITRSIIGNNVDRLRAVFHDPLFVRTGGQEIVPTARAESLAGGMRSLLGQMQDLASEQVFKPKTSVLHYTIGANDFQRDLILPELYRLVSEEVREFSLRTLIDEAPSVELLRTGEADLLLSPLAPEGVDILHKRLFNDQPRCFFDGNARAAPKTLDDFRQARYIGLNMPESGRPNPLSTPVSQDLEQRVSVRVPNFSGIASFMRDSDLLALAPGMLRVGTLAGFSSVKLPFNLPTVSMFMLWHKRYEGDPAHQWIRTQLESAVAGIMQRLREVK
jgi:DNA-binding transcriptional LysR family regulator